jgi:hypothetical protein
MATPKLIRVFAMGVLLINTMTIGFPQSTYFSIVILVDNRIANFPTTWMVGWSFSHLLGFLMHKSLTVLV